MDNVALWRGNAQRTGFYRSAQIPRSLPVVRWKFKAQGQILSAAAISNDRIFLSASDDPRNRLENARCRLYGLDQNTGKQRWKLFRNGEFSISSPTVWRSLVFWTTYEHLISGDIFAVDASTGRAVWKRPIQGLSLSPLMYQNLLYVEASCSLHAFTPTDGRVVWEITTDDRTYTPFVASGGRLFSATMKGLIFSLNASDGAFAWTRDIGAGGLSGLVIVGDYLYYLSSEHEGKLHALNHQTGRKLWEAELPAGESSPSTDGKFIYVGSYEGTLSCFDLQRRKIIWQHRSGSKIDGSPLLTPGVVCFGNDAGFVTALDSSTGKRLWRLKLESKIVHSVAIAGKTLYCGGTGGMFYALS